MADAPSFEGLPLSHDNDNEDSPGGAAVRILRYLDNDLKGRELEDFRAHINSCAACRVQLEAEKALSRILQRTRPLHSAPTALRARVAAAAIQHSAPTPTAEVPYRRAFQSLTGRLLVAGQRVLSLRVLAPALLVLAVCLAFVPSIVDHVHAASYTQAAVEYHRSYLSGHLRLGLQSSSPQAVTAWIANKVPFDFRLPAAEPAPGNQPAFKLTGAALVSYKGNPAALVTYERLNGQISLLVTSTKSAVVAGGEKIQFGKLTFHYRMDAGYRVITWSNHGLAYALVSSVFGPPKASCLVCHQNMADRD